MIAKSETIPMESAQIPSSVQQRISQLQRRKRNRAVLIGSMWGVTSLLGAMLLALVVDRQFAAFASGVRSVITLACLIVGVGAAWRVTRPIWRQLGWLATATQVDRLYPELEERWTTVAGVHADESDPLSRCMADQVRREAAAMAPLVEPARVAPADELRRPLMWLGGALLATLIFLGIDWSHHSILLERFWRPWSDASVTEITSVSGNLVVPRGEPLRLVADAMSHAGALPEAASLTLENERGERDTVAAAINARRDAARRGRYSYHFPALEESFRYRWQSGDGVTQWRQVEVVDSPDFKAVSLKITPPHYVDRPTVEKDSLPYRVSAAEGSVATIVAEPNTLLKRLEIVVLRGETMLSRHALKPDGGGRYHFEMRLAEDIAWRAEMLAESGLSPRHAPMCRFDVVVDRPPVARVLTDQLPSEVAADQRLEVPFEAHDDYGIAKAELLVFQTVEGERQLVSEQDIPLADQALAPHVRAKALLDVSSLDVPQDATLSYAIRVTDNRNLRRGLQGLVRREGLKGPRDGNVQNPSASSNAARESDAMGDLAARSDFPRGPESKDVQGGPNRSAEPVSSQASNQPASDQSNAGPDGTQPSIQSSVASSPPSSQTSDFARATETDPAGKTSKRVGTAEPESDDLARDSATLERDRELLQAARDPAPAESESLDGETTFPSPSLLAEDRDKPSHVQGPTTQADPAAGASNREMDDPDGDPIASLGAGGPKATSDDTAGQASSVLDERLGQLATSNEATVKVRENPLVRDIDSNDRIQRKTLRIASRLQAMRAELTAARDELDLLFGKVAANPDAVLMASGMEESAQAPLGLEDSAQAPLGLLKTVDGRLSLVESQTDSFYQLTAKTPLSFAGLQVVDITQSLVTPAHDDVRGLLKEPLVSTVDRVSRALNRVAAAVEELDALTQRVERVKQEQQLAKRAGEVVNMHYVFVKELRQLLRLASENKHPIPRKPMNADYDEDYLRRFKEVAEMQRDLEAALAQMLADDPRLRSRFANLQRRRERNFRVQLGGIRERQAALTEESLGWLHIDESQRGELWILIGETRIQLGADLVRQATELQDRAVNQLPLSLDHDAGIGGDLQRQVEQIGGMSRASFVQARRRFASGEAPQELELQRSLELTQRVDDLIATFEELDANNRQQDAITDYCEVRLAEA